ncbi:hypothetical protein MSPP1_002440 [Malassezia sp. CBS 17886]|nr:hypothetical protein MSPP1_002440 [Malassezia sp. CBS 17886]
MQRQGLLNSLLHGSWTAKEAVKESQIMNNGDSIKEMFEIMRVCVKPEFQAQYRAVVASMFPRVSAQYGDVMENVGNWEVIVGDMGNFYHIWKYQGYAGYDKVLRDRANPLQMELQSQLLPLIERRRNWLTQAFTFWTPGLPCRAPNSIFELRTYHLKPGHLLEWERDWRRGLEARRPYAEPVGAWFSHVGQLHTVFHIWEYPSTEQREKTRAEAWRVETWGKTVNKTVRMIDRMHSQIMLPLPV